VSVLLSTHQLSPSGAPKLVTPRGDCCSPDRRLLLGPQSCVRRRVMLALSTRIAYLVDVAVVVVMTVSGGRIVVVSGGDSGREWW
jgi:hypothetical protein